MRALDLEFHESMSNFLETERPTGQVGRDISRVSIKITRPHFCNDSRSHFAQEVFFLLRRSPDT